ncbi:hypothetical protein RI367_004104 [Sorochytrium milnesiophthora]
MATITAAAAVAIAAEQSDISEARACLRQALQNFTAHADLAIANTITSGIERTLQSRSNDRAAAGAALNKIATTRALVEQVMQRAQSTQLTDVAFRADLARREQDVQAAQDDVARAEEELQAIGRQSEELRRELEQLTKECEQAPPPLPSAPIWALYRNLGLHLSSNEDGELSQLVLASSGNKSIATLPVNDQNVPSSVVNTIWDRLG